MPDLSRYAGAVPLSLSMLGGVLAVAVLPELWPRWLAVVAFLLVLPLAWRWRGWRPFAALVGGFAWATLHGAAAMEARLPDELHGKDLVVVGRIEGLVVRQPGMLRFVLHAEEAQLAGHRLPLRGRLRLSWHGARQEVPPCSRWRLVLRLKRPRGLANPGGADNERTALAHRIVAVGYVREHPLNAMLNEAPVCIDGWRQALADGIAARVRDRRDAASLQAFAIGDTRGLDQHDWEVARANGIPHLIAISGFHVGVAAIGGVWLARLLYLLWPGLALRVPRPHAQAVLALLVAAGYGAMAGLGLATLRTLLMIALLARARCVRRKLDGATSLALALSAMLLLDPLATLSAGFWLSFAGVTLLMCWLEPEQRGLRGFIRGLWRTQLAMAILLLPLVGWFFGEVSLIGAFSNMLAIPLISFVVVPGALLAMVLLAACPLVAGPILWTLGWLMHGQWWVFEQWAQLPGARAYLPAAQPLALLLSLLGGLWLFAPRGVPGRGWSLVLFLPLWLPTAPRPESGAFEAWVLDVGQGLAVLLRTADHVLIYDTGPGDPTGFNMGDAVVVPSLHALGWRAPDRIIVSHADSDHAGGAQAVRRAFPRATISTGEPERLSDTELCAAGEQWTWNNVRFVVIHPLSDAKVPSNDRSCVLLVEGRHGSLLLSGDISSRVETQLLDRHAFQQPTVLLVPHHGSRSSSGERFIAGLRPSLAVISAGWRNRFGHPHPQVIARYDAARVPWLNTSDTGALRIDFPADAAPRVGARWRQINRHIWRE
ncbi:MAG TPA: DNA internalization-related competence protein ComEC/Rec2 [Dyella sp.]|uniref:DNA internalization-related competence protein ComEC/Rec2 n=1 Tax=Dyella sp. TaxID=1869338 RepID=UPI002F927A16